MAAAHVVFIDDGINGSISIYRYVMILNLRRIQTLLFHVQFMMQKN